MRAKRRNVCQICRSRKLACDGQQPACSQCVLRKIPNCSYHQDFTFVYQAPSKSPKHAASTGGGKATKLPGSNQQVVTRLSAHLALSPDYEIEDNIKCIVQSYHPGDRSTPTEFDPYRNQICGAWIGALPLLPATRRRRPFLWSAISTLATTIRHSSLRREAYQSPIVQMKINSLRQMGKAIEDAGGVFEIEHCIAIMCLAVADIMTPRLASSWVTHTRGVGRLIEQLKPETFSSGIFHLIFVGFRPLILISAILNRKATLFARKEWTDMPFRGQPISMIQQLFSRASVLPSLLERFDDATSHLEPTDLVEIIQLRQEFQGFIQSLHKWELICKSHAQLPLVSPRTNIGNPSPFAENALWFPDIMTANSLTHYWAFLIIAKTQWLALDREIAMLGDNTAQVLFELETEKSIADLAELIFRSMPYFLQPDLEAHHAGSTFFTFPIAMDFFRKNPDRYSLQLTRGRKIGEQLETRGVYFIPT